MVARFGNGLDVSGVLREVERYSAAVELMLQGANMTDCIRLTIQGGVGQILLDRPSKMNAITPEMTVALQKICQEIDARSDIRVVTIAGAGDRAFSAGSDMERLAASIGLDGVSEIASNTPRLFATFASR